MPRKVKRFPALATQVKNVGEKPVSALLLGSLIPFSEPSIPVWAVQPTVTQLLRQLGRKHCEITGAVIADEIRRFAELYLAVTSQLVRKKRFDLILDDESRSQLFERLVLACVKGAGQGIRKTATHSALTLQMQANLVLDFVNTFFHAKPAPNLIQYLRENLPELLRNLKLFHRCGTRCKARYSVPTEEERNELARKRTPALLRNAILGYCHGVDHKTMRLMLSVSNRA